MFRPKVASHESGEEVCKNIAKATMTETTMNEVRNCGLSKGVRAALTKSEMKSFETFDRVRETERDLLRRRGVRDATITGVTVGGADARRVRERDCLFMVPVIKW